MESIAISKFKEYCLKLLEEVSRTSEPLEITKNGKPLVVVYPVPQKKGELFGCMKGSAVINGDIVNPISLEEQEWRALR